MQYDTIEELILELALYPNRKIDILKDCAKKCSYGWFTVAKDGNCALFDENYELDDISKVKSIESNMILRRIEKINIPDNVTSIGKNAFYLCSKLTNVMIPNSVISIGTAAFWDCSKLKSVIIGNNVTSIGYGAFVHCYNLKSITFKGKTIEEVKSMENYPFDIEDTSIIKCER